MDFKAFTIAPKGRNKYGTYISSGKVTKMVTTASYGGDGSTVDIGGGNGGNEQGDGENLDNWLLFLSNTSGSFVGEEVAIQDKTDEIDLIGYRGTTRAQTYVGVITANEDESVYEHNLNIQGIVSGMSVEVVNNFTNNVKIKVTVTKDITKSSGTLKIPCNVYYKSDTLNTLADWGDSKDYTVSMNLEYNWSISVSPASSSYVLDLSNEVALVNASNVSPYNVLDGAIRPSCTASLYFGTTKITSGVTYELSYPNNRGVVGVGIKSNGVLNFASGGTKFNWNGKDPIALTITATYSLMTISKTMTIGKQIAGEDGKSPVTRWIETSVSSIAYDSNSGTVTPNTAISATVWKQEGENTPAIDNDTTIYWDYDTTAPSANSGKGTVTVSPYTPTVLGGHSYIAFALKKASSGYGDNPIYEIETVPIIKSGKNGSNGKDGTNGTNGKTPEIIDGYWWIGGVNTGIKAEGEDGESSVVTIGDNGHWYINGEDTGKIAVPNDGVGISAITEYYAIHTSNSSAPADNKFSTTFTAPTSAAPYLWNYELIRYTDNTTTKTTKAVIGNYSKDGDDGENGRGISAVTEYYAISSSSTVAPADSAFSTTFKVPTSASPYVWNYELITYTDGTTSKTNKAIIGVRGADGAEGPRGTKGAVVRGPVLFADQGNRWYYSGAEGEEFLDLVIYDGVIYRCHTSIRTSTWTGSDNWTAAGNNYDFVATDLLLANNAKINFLTGQGIYLANSAHTVTAGIEAATSDDDTVFWAGSNNSSNASFKVDYQGNITAKSGTFAGYVQMPYTFISDLKTNISLTSTATGKIYLVDCVDKGSLSSAPSNPQSMWHYYNTSNSRHYVYYNGSWRTMTVGTANGYISDEKAYLVADGTCGTYGMGDGGVLILPEPSASMNGFTYHILAVPNIATKASGQNPAISIRTANGTSSFQVWAYTTSLEQCTRLSFYGGHIEITCIPTHSGSSIKYLWVVTMCTGGVDCYTGSTYDYSCSYGTVASFSKTSPEYCITKIQSDTIPSTKDYDTLYIQR